MSKIKAQLLHEIIQSSMRFIATRVSTSGASLQTAIERLEPVPDVQIEYAVYRNWKQIQMIYAIERTPQTLRPDQDLKPFEELLFMIENEQSNSITIHTEAKQLKYVLNAWLEEELRAQPKMIPESESTEAGTSFEDALKELQDQESEPLDLKTGQHSEGANPA